MSVNRRVRRAQAAKTKNQPSITGEVAKQAGQLMVMMEAFEKFQPTLEQLAEVTEELEKVDLVMQGMHDDMLFHHQATLRTLSTLTGKPLAEVQEIWMSQYQEVRDNALEGATNAKAVREEEGADTPEGESTGT